MLRYPRSLKKHLRSLRANINAHNKAFSGKNEYKIIKMSATLCAFMHILFGKDVFLDSRTEQIVYLT